MASQPLGGIATVESQEDGRVLLSLPMVGFPKGFRLRSGDRVAVLHEESGPVARPLVRAIETSQDLSGATESVRVEEQRFELQAGTLRADAPRSGEPSEGYVLWVVESASAEAVPQVIALRPHQPAPEAP